MPLWEAHHFNGIAIKNNIRIRYIHIILSMILVQINALTGSFQRNLLRCIPLNQHNDSPQTIAAQLDGSLLRSENGKSICHKGIKQMFCRWPQVCGIDHGVYSKCRILWSRLVPTHLDFPETR